MDIIAKAARNHFPNGGKLFEAKSQTRTSLVVGSCYLFSALLSFPAHAANFDIASKEARAFVGGTFNNKVENTLTDDDTINPANGAVATNHLTGAVSTNRQMVVASKQHVNLGKYHGFLVNVQNDTDETWVFDGDRAIANLGKTNLQAASVDDVSRVAMPDKSLGREFVEGTGNAVVAAVTIGGAAAVKDMKNQGGPVTHRYGPDEARRIDEQSRFGRRVLLPGESSTGVLYFKRDKNSGNLDILDNASVSISIPVSLMYDAEDSNAITGLR
jgi:hypothetical protein